MTERKISSIMVKYSDIWVIFDLHLAPGTWKLGQLLTNYHYIIASTICNDLIPDMDRFSNYLRS